MCSWWVTVVSVLLLTFVRHGQANSAESRLFSDLLQGYNAGARPVKNVSDPVTVQMGFTLQQLEVHEMSSTVTLHLWMNFEWKEYRFAWDPSEYDGLESIRLRPDQVWIPDIVPYNMLPSPRPDWIEETLVVVQSSGDLLYVPPTSLKIHCTRDFQFQYVDSFRCQVKFGSWTYSGFQIDLALKGSSVDTSSYVRNPMWELHNTTLRRHVIYYACCPEPYLDVTAEIELRRPEGTVWPNAPVAVCMIVLLMTFLVPVTSSQKLTLPCVSLAVILAAEMSHYNLNGDAEYVAYFSRVYQVYTYVALASLVWAVLMVALARPRQLRLPACLHACLSFRWLSAFCCLEAASDHKEPEDAESRRLCHDWAALAGILDRIAGTVFFILLVAGSGAAQ